MTNGDALREPSVQLPIIQIPARRTASNSLDAVDSDLDSDATTVALAGGQVVDASPLLAVIDRQVEFKFTQYSGPFPDPELLAGYKQLGYGDLVVGMVSDQLEYTRQRDQEERDRRHELAAQRLRSQQRLAERGQMFGAILASAVLAGAVWLILAGHDAAGISLLAVDFVGVGGAFVYSQHRQRAQRRAQQPQDTRRGGAQRQQAQQGRTRNQQPRQQANSNKGRSGRPGKR